MFFKKSARTVREPDETVLLSPQVEAVIWRQQANDGSLDIRFGLNRIDAKGNVRRTFSPSVISELVAALGALAIAIGQSTGIEPRLAAELKELGAGIVKVLESLSTNGIAEGEKAEPKRLFA